MRVLCKPQPKDFVTFIQSFGNIGILPKHFSIDQYNKDHRLVPYGHRTYGIHPRIGYTLYSINGTLNECFDESREAYKNPQIIVKFNHQEYEAAKGEYDKFWEWRKNRNSVRLKMEQEFHFDGKHAAHLVRLLRMGAEALETGKLTVFRPDAQELLSIRHGAWTYEEVVEYAEYMDNHIRRVLLPATSLPKTPNILLASKLIIDIQEAIWHNHS